MRKLFSFVAVTLDGYYEGPNGEFDWPNVDAEFNEFSISQLNDIDTLLFGRVTYEGMASYWSDSRRGRVRPDHRRADEQHSQGGLLEVVD